MIVNAKQEEKKKARVLDVQRCACVCACVMGNALADGAVAQQDELKLIRLERTCNTQHINTQQIAHTEGQMVE